MNHGTRSANNYNTGKDAHWSEFMTANFVPATTKRKRKPNTCDEAASPSRVGLLQIGTGKARWICRLVALQLDLCLCYRRLQVLSAVATLIASLSDHDDTWHMYDAGLATCQVVVYILNRFLHAARLTIVFRCRAGLTTAVPRHLIGQKRSGPRGQGCASGLCFFNAGSAGSSICKLLL